MGRKKIKKPLFKPAAKPQQSRPPAPGLQYAMTMANYQMQVEKEARKVIAIDKAVDSMQRQYTASVENWFFGLMALALHDEGFGAKRICRVAEKIRDYHNELNDPEFGDFDLWEQVERETGLKADIKDGGFRKA